MCGDIVIFRRGNCTRPARVATGSERPVRLSDLRVSLVKVLALRSAGAGAERRADAAGDENPVLKPRACHGERRVAARLSRDRDRERVLLGWRVGVEHAVSMGGRARAAPRYAGLSAFQVENSGGSIIYMGSVHSKEASVLKAPYVTAKHGLIGLAKTVAKEGAKHGVRANVICPGFVRTPLVDKQIPEQAKELGISEQDVVKHVMLKDTVDGEFTTVEDVAEAALFFAAFESNALTGQSLVVSHGWLMQ
jgi:NAD(P)-dependent dehydrogenase (short-subunit alcohol dehydrogenase family)